MSGTAHNTNLLNITAEIVSAHVSHNAVTAEILPSLIRQVYHSLAGAGLDMQAEPEAERPEPAVNPKRSVFHDHIICLEDGKRVKALRRHLNAAHGMTPEQYRERWDLPSNYPMVAPDYAQARSALAKSIGLGRKPMPSPDEMPKDTAVAEDAVAESAEPAAKPVKTRQKRISVRGGGITTGKT